MDDRELDFRLNQVESKIEDVVKMLLSADYEHEYAEKMMPKREEKDEEEEAEIIEEERIENKKRAKLRIEDD